MSQRGKKVPAYSSDMLALRLIAGLLLIALGAVVFIAVALNMQDPFFTMMREVSFGLTGSLAYVLPLMLVWAGVLTVWSTQRKAPVKPWLFAMLTFVGISTVMILLTRTSTGMLVDSMKSAGWGGAVSGMFNTCKSFRQSGGALGTLLGWSVGTYLGPILGCVILIPATLLSALMIFGITPKKAFELVTGKITLSRLRSEKKHAGDGQRQMELQQEQERMQQAAYAQQQAWMLQQQQMQQQQMQQQQTQQQQTQQPAQQGQIPMQTAAQPGYASYPQPGQAPVQPDPAYQSGVQEWVDSVSTGQTVQQNGRPHESKLFRRNEEKAAAAPKRKSRIFSRGDEYDGLTERTSSASASAAARRNAQPAGPAENPAYTGNQTGPGGEQTYRPAQEPRAQQPYTPTPVQTENPDNYRRPEDRAARYARPAEEEESAEKPVRTDGRRNRVTVRAEEEEPADETPARREPATERRTERTKQEQIDIPKVTPIGEEAWKPDLKLPPKKEEDAPAEDDYWQPTPYNYPLLTNLKKPEASVLNTQEEDIRRSQKLVATLASFKVLAEVRHVTHGPAISRFELELAAGTRVGKVAELEKDIAYGMEATSIRIEAPIPGQSLVGVEVPNKKVNTVTLREVLESEPMQNARSILTVALGKDIAGKPIVCDLAKMPHMLIAGATGSGKSVCINAIINSLLFRASPDEVKLILVDPKVVELQCYNGIPHLLIPVVNDPHKASAALAWAVAEMMERYDKFAGRKVRNLEGYNEKIGPGEKPLPRIVIIIDELADLMMVCKKDVEEYICRLTQLARAAGIHLIVATQRPSVDVITGLIKANIPSRIAFKTASSVDSRTILDRNGSEQLLGWGDMLYLPTGSFAPTRIQGCFLSDEEVNRIATQVRESNPSTYDPDILDKLEELTAGAAEPAGADMIGGTAEAGGADADLFAQAVEYAIQDGQISTSTLQRRLKVGYARAGRLTDEMEERGIVAAKDGSKPRKCLITREQWEEMKRQTEGMT